MVTKLRLEGHKVPPSRPQSYVFTMQKRHFRSAKIVVLEGVSAMFMGKKDNLFGCLKGWKFAMDYVSICCAQRLIFRKFDPWLAFGGFRAILSACFVKFIRILYDVFFIKKKVLSLGKNANSFAFSLVFSYPCPLDKLGCTSEIKTKKTFFVLYFARFALPLYPELAFTPYLYMKELQLKYGCNPNQKPSRIFMQEGELPIEVINGRPGYINFLDALNAWQLVKELKEATGLPAAASFKHVSPAGAAVGLPLSDTLKKIYFVDDVKGLDESPVACAYARARGADRMSSYGDFVALSDTCDATTALLLKREVSDGVIAPDFTAEAIEILKDKRKGTYNVIKIDPTYKPEPIERKQCFGVTFEQGRNEIKLDDPALFENIPTENKTFTAEAKRDLIIALITLKYTQSNSVCYVKDGQAIGIGAGQQSRIHCTRLAGNKADIWWLRQHPKVMALPFKEGIRRADRDNTIDVYISEDEHDDVLRDGAWQQFFTRQPEVLTLAEKKEWIAKNTKVALGSDAFFPFGDNIERAHKSGVEFIAQAGGSVRDDHVIMTCDKYGIAMAFTGVRLFHH